MAEKIKREADGQKVNKQFVAEIKAIDKKNYTVEAVVSDESVDRYKEVVLADAYIKDLPTYKKHPILLSSHDYDGLTKQIGEAEYIAVEGKKLKAKFKYYVGEGNPEADWAWILATKRIAAYSVGFIGHTSMWKEDYPDHEIFQGKNAPNRAFTRAELLEISQVLVPANTAALQNGLSSDNIVVRTLSEKIFNDFVVEEKDGKLIELIEKNDWEMKEALIKDIYSEKKDAQVVVDEDDGAKCPDCDKGECECKERNLNKKENEVLTCLQFTEELKTEILKSVREELENIFIEVKNDFIELLTSQIKKETEINIDYISPKINIGGDEDKFLKSMHDAFVGDKKKKSYISDIMIKVKENTKTLSEQSK